MTATAEFLYNKDVNGVYYINANLPAAQTAFVGPDNRPRWTNGRIHSHISSAVVLKNQDVGSSWNIAASLQKRTTVGLVIKGAYSYNMSKNTVDPGSIAFGSWAGNPHAGDPNNPGVAYRLLSEPRWATGSSCLTSFTRQYFSFGSTSVSLFSKARNDGNTQLRVRWRHERRRRLGQRSDLHPARCLGDELRAVHVTRRELYRGGAGCGV